MTTRFAGGTSPITVNTGNVLAGATFTVDSLLSNNWVNIAKIKVIPSGSTVGYVLQIFRHATRLAADLMFATKTSVQGNFYTPTNRTGGESLEAWVLPYEDQDNLKELHISLTNNDSVTRSYTIYVEYEDPVITLAGTTNVRGSVVFATAEPDANYFPVVTGSADETFWVTGLGTTGFTIHSSNASSTATVYWHNRR